MELTPALLLDPAKFDIFVSNRLDRAVGSGSAGNPYNGATRTDLRTEIILNNPDFSQEAVAVGPRPHGFVNGDVVTVSGVEGADQALWNGTFGIYGVDERMFRYWMKAESFTPPGGRPIAVRRTFPFDEVMQKMPPRSRIFLGPGLFQTRGFAQDDQRGWQPKVGQKIVGSGVGVTTLQLVGAENVDQHYHVVGMPIEPNGTSTVEPLNCFEISDLTIDCNIDNQPTRLDRYLAVAVSALSRSGDLATATVLPGHVSGSGNGIDIFLISSRI